MSEPNYDKSLNSSSKPTPAKQRFGSTTPKAAEEVKSRHAITIGLPPEDVFAFWRDFRNLPLFMKDLREVHVISPTRSHWIVELKSGLKVEWDAEIVEEVSGSMISWQSLEGSQVSTKGTVWFEEASGAQGAVVRLAIDYHVPGGKLAEAAAFFTGESPEILIKTNLKRLKAYLETGEIPTTQGQPSGREEDSDVKLTH